MPKQILTDSRIISTPKALNQIGKILPEAKLNQWTQIRPLHYNSGTEQMNFFKCKDVNFSKIQWVNIPQAVKANFQKVMKTIIRVLANPYDVLPCNANIVTTIRMAHIWRLFWPLLALKENHH